MDNSKQIAVIAGTPVDTAMGVEFLKNNIPDSEIFAYPVSETPQEQTLFQVMSREKKEHRIGDILTRAKANNIGLIFVYCNSLSGSVDFKKLAEDYGLHIVTPLAAYEEIGRQFQRFGVIAANNQSLAGIENAALSGNPDTEVIGVSLLPAVKDIENGKSPADIVSDWSIPSLISFFAGAGAQAVVLGCTHFPYFEKELVGCSSLPIINPAEYMLATIKETR